jgi:exodeoxyribonuclease-3
MASKAPAALVGDFNVIPTELDVYSPERWRDDALFRHEVREEYAKLLAAGWTDALRALSSDERIYTFWKYWRNSFARDAGLRIDHFLLSPILASRLMDGGVDRAVRGEENASDHAPVWIQIAPPRGSARRAPRRASTGS